MENKTKANKGRKGNKTIYMNNILNDIKTATNLFGDIRKARKDGQEVTVKKVREIPIITGCIICNGFCSTIEGCALAGVNSRLDSKAADTAQKTFNALPEKERQPFLYSPKDGEYIKRYQFWRRLLGLVLVPKQHHKAMCTILRNYIRIKNMKTAAAPSVRQPSKRGA